MIGTSKRLIVVGGGAAGFFCAVNAARMNPSLEVVLLEKSARVLQKVKVSGGGRCNVTHQCESIAEMARCYPRGEKFVKKAFHHFFVPDTVEWFASRGVRLKTEGDGRMFPVSDSSQSIIDCLLKEADQHGVKVKVHQGVAAITQIANQWKVVGDSGLEWMADFVCIACGGFGKTSQFDWITKATGHTISPPVPSLFTFNLPGNSITSLMGITVPLARVRIGGTKIESEGPVLITHWGLSGPAVLRTSAFGARELAERQYDFTAMVNWLPRWNETSLREKLISYRNEKGNQKVVNTDWLDLPQRLLEFLLQRADLHPDTRWAELTGLAQNKLAKLLCSHELQANGKTTFKEEFVTAGGITLQEISSSSMESQLHHGLYFAGEVMDVDGITGGFNFQHAWTSGYLAAESIAKA